MPLVEATTGQSMETLLEPGDVSVSVYEKLTLVLDMFTGVTVEVRSSSGMRRGTAATDAPKDVLPVVASMLGVTLDELLATVRVPGVEITKDGPKRAGKDKDATAGMLLGRQRREIDLLTYDSCVMCDCVLNSKVRAARTQPSSAVQVAACYACAKSSEIVVGGVLYRKELRGRAGVLFPQRRVPLQLMPTPEESVGVATLLAVQRAHKLGSRVTHPLALLLLETPQLAGLVGSRLVFSELRQLQLRIVLRRLIETCYVTLSGEYRAKMDAECERHKRHEVRALAWAILSFPTAREPIFS
jgi:hypothetical protein